MQYLSILIQERVYQKAKAIFHYLLYQIDKNKTNYDIFFKYKAIIIFWVKI